MTYKLHVDLHYNCTGYLFVPCAQVCGKLFESQDKLCDLKNKISSVKKNL